MVSSSICGSCAAHSGWMFAVAPSRANRGTSSGCTTCRWARWWRSAGAVGGAGGFDGVERLADGAVAERVEVHLEAGASSASTYSRSATGSTKLSPPWPVGSRSVEVGLEHARR